MMIRVAPGGLRRTYRDAGATWFWSVELREFRLTRRVGGWVKAPSL